MYKLKKKRKERSDTLSSNLNYRDSEWAEESLEPKGYQQCWPRHPSIPCPGNPEPLGAGLGIPALLAMFPLLTSAFADWTGLDPVAVLQAADSHLHPAPSSTLSRHPASSDPQTPALVGGWGGSHLSHKELTTLPSAVMVQISPWHTPVSKELAVTHAPDQKEKKK